MDVARKLEVPKLMLVVNKVLSTFDHGSQTIVQRRLTAPRSGVLPLTEDMWTGSSDLFCVRFPDHPLSQRFREIVARIVE